MTDYKKYINALRKCAKEHENDRTFTGHIIVSDLCRDTANLLESLDQEPVLDKIRAEIEKVVWYDVVVPLDGKDETRIPTLDPDDVFEIIDKYKAESEE